MRDTHPGPGTGREARTGAAVLGVAGLGLILGHWLTYALDAPDVPARTALLAETGHGYLPVAAQLAVMAGIAGFAAVFLGRVLRRDRDHDRSARGTFAQLAGFQVGAFLAMEVLERAATGASVLHLLQGTILPIGVAVQILVAAAGLGVLRLLLRVADAVADLTVAPPPDGPGASWALHVAPVRPTGAGASDALPIRGPPPPLRP